jgi:ubiquinone/menaquinone biosynthesis C-methylase UbiE/uncharacterized protein YbaR (Trm112 family)
LSDIALVCPACRNPLAADHPGELRCHSCPRSFPVILGIPDLRLWPDPYIGIEEDRAKARHLADQCATLTFEASVLHYYAITSAVPPFQANRFTRALLAATGRAAYALRDWEKHAGRPGVSTAVNADGGGEWAGVRLLDLGCGTAPLLVAGHARGVRGVGVDIAMRWLILAKKRLEEAGVNAPLVCACAEALPFPTGCFERVAGESAIEHVRDQSAAVSECARVLAPGGWLFLSTPNRLSPGPDPHTGLWAGSLLPPAWTARYVRRKGGVPPQRRLLDARQLRQLLEREGFESVWIDVPDVADEQRAGFRGVQRLIVDAYRMARRFPATRSALRVAGPLLHAAGRKAAPAP